MAEAAESGAARKQPRPGSPIGGGASAFCNGRPAGVGLQEEEVGVLRETRARQAGEPEAGRHWQQAEGSAEGNARRGAAAASAVWWSSSSGPALAAAA